MTWMQRLKRVFNIDIEICQACGSKVKVIASIDAAMPDLDDAAQQMLLRKAQTKGRRSFDAKLSREISALLDKYNFHDT